MSNLGKTRISIIFSFILIWVQCLKASDSSSLKNDKQLTPDSVQIEYTQLTDSLDTIIQKSDLSYKDISGVREKLRLFFAVNDVDHPELSAQILTRQSKLTSKLIDSIVTSQKESEYSKAVFPLIGLFLEKIRKDYIPNYVEKEVLLNVPIPTGVTGFPGMDPKSISNPVLRAQYETKIAENTANAFANTRQFLIRRAIQQHSLELKAIQGLDRYIDISSDPWRSFLIQNIIDIK